MLVLNQQAHVHPVAVSAFALDGLHEWADAFLGIQPEIVGIGPVLEVLGGYLRADLLVGQQFCICNAVTSLVLSPD